MPGNKTAGLSKLHKKMLSLKKRMEGAGYAKKLDGARIGGRAEVERYSDCCPKPLNTRMGLHKEGETFVKGLGGGANCASHSKKNGGGAHASHNNKLKNGGAKKSKKRSSSGKKRSKKRCKGCKKCSRK